MADGEGGGGGGGGEGGGSSECLPMDDLVEAMLSNSQALAEALAADRARREAALKEKDAEIDRLRAEAADARKKLQADASRKMRWEAAYELLLGANQKLAELRDADMEDSRTCAETPNSKSKEVESCTDLSQNTVDHAASDLRKSKQAFETLSSKKDKEVSALLSKNDSLRSQLDRMQHGYAELLMNKEVEAAQATEAALKLQKSVDELNVLAQKKDDEIARLQAEAMLAIKKHDNDLTALLSVHNQLSIMQQDYTELLKKKKVLTNKMDHEIVILRAEFVGAKKKVQKQATEAALKLQKSVDELKVLAQKKDDEIDRLHSLVKEKDDEIQRLKGWHAESVPKHYKDISETHKRSRSGDPAVTVRDKLKNTNLRQTVEENYMSETKTVEKDGQEEATQKRRRASSMSNDDEKSGSNGDDDEQIGSDEDGEKQSGSDEDGEKQSGSNEDGDEQSGSGEDDDDDDDNEKLSGSDEETTHNERKGYVSTWFWDWKAPAPLRSRKLKISNGQRKLKISNGQRSFGLTGHWGKFVKAVNDSLVDQPDKHKEFVWFLRNFRNWRVRAVARTMQVLLDGQPKLIRQFNQFLPNNCQIEVKEEEEEEKQQPEVEETHQPIVLRPCGQLPSASVSAAAGLIKLKEAEQQSKWEQYSRHRR